MIKKKLEIAYDAMMNENRNSVGIENTPFNLVRLEEKEFAIVCGNTMIVKCYINELAEKFEDNFYNTLFWLIDNIVDFKLKEEEVTNE